MNFITTFLIAIGLSMDCFAVCLSGGICMRSFCWYKSIKAAIVLGGFHGGMTCLGWLLGSRFNAYITNFDHWIAFLLLGYLGSKMIYESFQKKETLAISFSFKILLLLSIATSIDALAVGISMAFLQTDIWYSAGIITMTTFLVSFCGIVCGFRFRQIKAIKVELFGGLVLVVIGIKILVEHTLLC